MITAEVQVHGYRKGHQLLASSIELSKEDQAVVDRLSDVAGPLRPKEQFAPYLTAYPLPSGTYYVLARTWQDDVVSRAGCVRTMSVLIDAQAWSFRPPIESVLLLLGLTALPTEADAISIVLEDMLKNQLSPAAEFNSSELLEALFLEDMKPVVVFDVPAPELVGLRLIASLWPEMRRRFALSTFALSPRKIGGRDFDLVFAPSSVKSKFSDWQGRRVDGRPTQSGRHKWTKSIVRRVFEEPVPELLSDKDIELLGNFGADSTAALRITLLWGELLDKLDQTPKAVLGLLDIANSGMVSKTAAINILEPQLAKAMSEVEVHMLPKDAWEFLSAIANKIHGQNMPNGRTAVEKLIVYFAEKEPSGAVNILQQADPKGAIYDLLPSIAFGLGNGPASMVEQLLAEVPTDIIARLVSLGGVLTSRVSKNDFLLQRMGVVLEEVDRELADKAGKILLPYLVDDRHFVAALPIICRLDIRGVVSELRWLGEVNNFQSELLCTALVDRAIEIDGLMVIRDVLISSNKSKRRDELLAQTLGPFEADVLWLLDEQRLPEKTTTEMLENVLTNADDKQFALLLSDKMVGERIVERLPKDSFESLARVVMQNNLSMSTYIHTINLLIPRVDENRKFEIATTVIETCLRNQFHSADSAELLMLLSIIGARLDGRKVARAGLERSVVADVASRNLIVFEKASPEARKRIVIAVDEMARALSGRHVMDLTESAYDACATLMLDAQDSSRDALMIAAGLLMPSLLSENRKPVSKMIAALFPIIYQELAKSGEVADILKFVPFLDWDRCKKARQKLADAFIHSNWKAGDLALTGLMCNDLYRILNEVAQSFGGKEYLIKIESDLGRLNESFQYQVKSTIKRIRANKFSK